MKVTAATLLILAVLAPISVLAQYHKVADPFLQCADGRTCTEHKVDIAYAVVTCIDANDRTALPWGCEYEWGYQCNLKGTDEFRKGGMLPVMSSMCDHLCGECKSGWK